MRLGCISTSAYVFIMAISSKLVGFTFTEGEIGFSLQINSKLKIHTTRNKIWVLWHKTYSFAKSPDF